MVTNFDRVCVGKKPVFRKSRGLTASMLAVRDAMRYDRLREAYGPDCENGGDYHEDNLGRRFAANACPWCARSLWDDPDPVAEPEHNKETGAIAPGDWTGAYARMRGSKLVHRYAKGEPGRWDRSVCGKRLGVKCDVGPIAEGETACRACGEVS
jgi:hypothetical protein